MKYRPDYIQIVFVITLLLMSALTILKYMEVNGKEWIRQVTFPLTLVSFSFVLLYFYLVKKHRKR